MAAAAIHQKGIGVPARRAYPRHMRFPDGWPLLIGLWFCTVAIPRSAQAAANVWQRVRYEGGTIDARVNRFDWNTTVTITSDTVVFVFGGYKSVRIAAGDITALSYGQKAYRRVADMATLSVFLTPVALFGVLHKSKDHLIGMEFRGADGKPGAVLLMVHKDRYREFLLTLKDMTGKAVENWP